MKIQWKKALIAWISLLALMGSANAGLLVEPFAGYDLSMSGELETTPDVTKVKWSSFQVGGRIGWVFKWLGIGLQFDWMAPKATWETTPEYEQDITMTNGGAFIGLYLGHRGQWMIRGKYNFMATAKSDFNHNGIAATWEYKGMGYGIGLGYRFIHWLALNVDYTMTTYDELSGNSNVPEFKTSDLLISISFPLEFPSRSSR